MTMVRFPKDCWDKDCPHFHTVDMSVDDLLCACDVLNVECDACDEDFSLLLCPQEPRMGRTMEENISLKAALEGAITVYTREYGSIEVVPVDFLASIASGCIGWEWLDPPRNRDYQTGGFIECPCCGYIEDHETNYCAGCGIKMRGIVDG